MRKLGLLLWMLAFTAVGAQAQNIIKSLERTVPGQGKVLKAAGFRIQAYAGNNTREAKNDAYRVASRIKEYFPELTIYTSFNPPRWLCRVGDFRSIEEADAMMRKLKATGVFKEVSIVKDQINIPL